MGETDLFGGAPAPVGDGESTTQVRLGAPIDHSEMLAVFDDEVVHITRSLGRQVSADRISSATMKRRLAVLARIRERLVQYELEEDFLTDCLRYKATVADCLDVLRGWYPDAKQQIQGNAP